MNNFFYLILKLLDDYLDDSSIMELWKIIYY